MADLLNQAIYERDINKLEGLLLEGVDPNDLSGSESPLKIVIEYGKPEELELLLDYGADPNIDNGSGITVFTDIIFLILSSIIGRNPDEEPEYFIPYLQVLLYYGIDMNKSEPGHPSPIRAINDWPTDYSHNAAWYRNRGIMSNPDSNDIWASEQLNKIIQDILDEQEKYKTYLAKQRLSLGKTGLSKNITDSIMKNLDYDTFNMIGENMLEDQYYYDNDSINRYYPGETYSEYREALYGDESEDKLQKRRIAKRKKTKKKHNKKKWGRAKKGGTLSSSDRRLIEGMDKIPYHLRSSHKSANELIRAVIKNDPRKIKQLLLLGADINSENPNMMTALHSAIFITQNINMIKFLLQHGANPNIRRYNIPIINLVIKSDYDLYTKKKIIELLIRYGGSFNYNNRDLTLDEKKYLRDAKLRAKNNRLKRLNFSKLMSNRLGEFSLQPEEPENITKIGEMIDEAEEKQRDNEIRNELISDYLESIN
jgi:ankyrin repeat protein